jgi:hypothetical protein
MNLLKLLKKDLPFLGKKPENTELIKLYPNPTSDTIKVIFSTKKPRTLKLSNNQGKEIFLRTLNEETSTKLNLELLPDGIYYLDVNTNYGKTTKLIIKE